MGETEKEESETKGSAHGVNTGVTHWGSSQMQHRDIRSKKEREKRRGTTFLSPLQIDEGSSCSSTVEHTPPKSEVMSSNLVGWFAFVVLLLSFPTFLKQQCVLNQGTRGGVSRAVTYSKKMYA